MIQKLFNDFNNINKLLDDQLLEISVKQHQITLLLNKSLYFNNLQKILDYINQEKSYITFHNDFLCVVLGGFEDEVDKKSLFYNFLSIIKEMSVEICQCPALEYVVSSQYVKCYLDKTGLNIEDLVKYEKILKAEAKGELEMHPQRPYMLFINEEITYD